MRICGKYLGGGKMCNLLHGHGGAHKHIEATPSRVAPMTVGDERVVPLTTDSGERMVSEAVDEYLDEALSSHPVFPLPKPEKTDEEALAILDRAHKMTTSSPDVPDDSTLYGMAARIIRKQAGARMIRSASEEEIVQVLIDAGVSSDTDDDHVFSTTVARELMKHFYLMEKP